MKKTALLIICALMLLTLCACNNQNDNTSDSDNISASSDQVSLYSDCEIIGTWICEDINEECYFIFEENGDAYAKWGTSTVYGYFDYYEEENVYDIDVPNFLYNEYEAKLSGDHMTLTSDETSYDFEKATMPEITIKAPDNLEVDKKILGNWQSADSYECYRFNKDGTAVITDLYNYATIDCKYSCDKGVVTFYYMSGNTKDGTREAEYSLKGGKLTLAGYTYENVD